MYIIYITSFYSFHVIIHVLNKNIDNQQAPLNWRENASMDCDNAKWTYPPLPTTPPSSESSDDEEEKSEKVFLHQPSFSMDENGNKAPEPAASSTSNWNTFYGTVITLHKIILQCQQFTNIIYSLEGIWNRSKAGQEGGMSG
jgi:hypothetical protein